MSVGSKAKDPEFRFAWKAASLIQVVVESHELWDLEQSVGGWKRLRKFI